MNSLHDAWTVDDQAESQPVSGHKHRHWIVAPIFLFVAVSLMATATTSLHRAELLPTMHTASADIRTLSDGTQFLPDRDAVLSLKDSVLTLSGGSMLVSALGESHVRLGSGSSLLGWNGGYAVHRSKDSITVAAISTPVLVRLGKMPLFVPSGMQWTIKMQTVSGSDILGFMDSSLPMVLPSDYRRSQQERLERFPSVIAEEDEVEDPTVVQVIKGMAPILDTKEQRRSQLVAKLHAATASGDVLTVTDLLRSVDQDTFTSPKGQRQLAELLSLSAPIPALSSRYLTLEKQSDLSLLLMYHPAIRAQAFVLLNAKDVSSTDRTSLLFLYPFIDTLPDPLPSLVHNRWKQETAKVLRQQKDSLQALSVLLKSMHATALQLRAAQFQDRLTQLVDDAHAFTDEWESVLSDEQRAILSSLDELAVPPAIPLPKSSTPSSALYEVPLTPAEANAVIERVQDVLQEKGAMFTRNTSVEALSYSKVQILSVVFATAQGDQSFSFTFNPETLELSNIVRDGQKQTNGVTLEQFIEWISK